MKQWGGDCLIKDMGKFVYSMEKRKTGLYSNGSQNNFCIG